MITYQQWMEEVVKGKKRFIYTENVFSGQPEALRTNEAYYKIGNDGRCYIERYDNEVEGEDEPVERYVLTEEEIGEKPAGCNSKKTKGKKK